MENIKSTVEHLQDLIDARNDMKSSINNKGVQVSGGLMSYAYAIDRIPQTIVNGDDLNVGMIDVEYTSNGQYNINPVNYKYDALSGVNLNINVPTKKVGMNAQPIEITKNGVGLYKAKDYSNYDGLSTIAINVDVPKDVNVGTGNVEYTENGSYTISASNYSVDALSSVGVTVNVPTKKIGTNISSILQIKSNGIKVIKASDYGYDGLREVHIMTNVPTKSLTTTTKEFTENGQYTIKASDYGYDGLSQIDLDINVPPVIIGGGSEIDFTQVGWSQEDSDEANMREQEYINHAMQYTLEKYGSELDALEFENYGDEEGVKISPFINDYRMVIAPKIINLDKIKGFKSPGSESGTYIPSSLFRFCYSLRHIPVLDTSNITDMYMMFYGCSSLTSIPYIDTSNVTDMYMMFEGCESLTTIPLLNTSKVDRMYMMFAGCYSLTTIPKIDTSKVWVTARMFEGCKSLTTIPQLDTSNATDMYSMFNLCESLTTIPQLDTSNATRMNTMFRDCSSLTTVPILDTSKVESVTDMFIGCSSLKNIGGFVNLNTKLDLSDSPLLTIESIENIANTVSSDSSAKLIFNEECLIRLYGDYPERLNNAIETLTNKGWDVIS